MSKNNIAENNNKVNPRDFNPYIDLPERSIFPLHRWDAIDPETKDKLGKVPKVKWSKYVLTENKLENVIRTNHNLGFRIPDDMLIIDYDPRNDKKGDALKRLIEQFDISSEACPVVHTGGGGTHMYFKKPKNFSTKKSLKAYKGIDFLSKGCFVVCAGSIHPNGKRYVWDDFCDNNINQKNLLSVPETLLEELDRSLNQSEFGDGSSWGEFDEEQLERCLSVLPAEDFREHEVWLKMMMSAHFMTGGLGFDVFQAWCETDEVFIGSENMHRNRWYSLTDKGNKNSVGSGSIFKEISERGSNWRECVAISAEKDFQDLDSELEDILLNSEETHNVLAGKLYKAAMSLDVDNANAIDIGRIFNKLDDIPIAVRAKILEHFFTKLKIQKSELGKYSQAAKKHDKHIRDTEDKTEDMARRLARAVLKYKYSGNKLLYIKDVWWQYLGTHWEKVDSDAVIGRVVKDVLDKFRKKHDDVTFGSETMLITSTIKMLSYEVATTVSEVNMFSEPKPVINCKNGELWILPDGTVDFRNHDPKSLLTIAPTIIYRRKAKSKLFKAAMMDTFKNFHDVEDMVRHVEEMIGYMIQPKKDIDAFWLFKGPGGDGKTTLTEIIIGLCGIEAAAPMSIETLSKNNAHSLHAIVSKLVVVDDDLNSLTRLDDGVMKKLSSNKILSANPKFQQEFNFVNTAQLIMCSNSFPRYFDLSRGLKRRMQIIPFNREFDIKEGGEIKSFSSIILGEAEVSGVLNIVLKGLRRLRKRGKFKKPASCIVEEKNWSVEANPMEEFLFTCVRERKNKDTSGIQIYNAYCGWYATMFGEDSHYRLSMRKFYQDLQQSGYEKILQKGNVVGFKNISINKEYRGEF